MHSYATLANLRQARVFFSWSEEPPIPKGGCPGIPGIPKGGCPGILGFFQLGQEAAYPKRWVSWHSQKRPIPKGGCPGILQKMGVLAFSSPHSPQIPQIVARRTQFSPEQDGVHRRHSEWNSFSLNQGAGCHGLGVDHAVQNLAPIRTDPYITQRSTDEGLSQPLTARFGGAQVEKPIGHPAFFEQGFQVFRIRFFNVYRIAENEAPSSFIGRKPHGVCLRSQSIPDNIPHSHLVGAKYGASVCGVSELGRHIAGNVKGGSPNDDFSTGIIPVRQPDQVPAHLLVAHIQKGCGVVGELVEILLPDLAHVIFETA